MVRTALRNKGTDGVSPPNSFYDIARALTKAKKRSQLLLPTLNREPTLSSSPSCIMSEVRYAAAHPQIPAQPSAFSCKRNGETQR